MIRSNQILSCQTLAHRCADLDVGRVSMEKLNLLNSHSKKKAKIVLAPSPTPTPTPGKQNYPSEPPCMQSTPENISGSVHGGI